MKRLPSLCFIVCLGLAAAPCILPTSSARAMQAEPNIRKIKPLPLYAAHGPTTSAEVGGVVEAMMTGGTSVVVFVNTHGMPGTGSPWGAGVGTCPAIEWDAKHRAKPVIKNMQTLFAAATVTSATAAAHDALLIAAVGAELQKGHTVVLGWCYGALWATTHAAAIRKAAGI